MPLLMVACAARGEARPIVQGRAASAPRRSPPAAVTAPVADEVPPSECGRPTWRTCLEAARSLESNMDATYHPSAVRIYRLLCEEGDQRRCFEPDTATELAATCRANGFAEACYRLGELHARGEATCPVDDACAAMLFEMACNAGHRAACGSVP